MAVVRRAPPSAVGAARDLLVGRGLSEAQKYWIARVRPDLEPHLVVVKTSSFPSGHAASSMIFYLTLALALTAGTRWQRPAVAGAILLSLAIGTSRVMLGVHWPSDVDRRLGVRDAVGAADAKARRAALIAGRKVQAPSRGGTMNSIRPFTLMPRRFSR